MDANLRGLNPIKSPKKRKSIKKINSPNSRKPIDKFTKLKEDTNQFNENEISSEQVNVSFVTSKAVTNKTNEVINNNEINKNSNNENYKINNNNFISIEDRNKKNKQKILSKKDFERFREERYKRIKDNEKMLNELKEEYVEYIMFKEPTFTDFDKIYEEYKKRLYLSYQKYNSNLLVIKSKKLEVKHIISLIEKSLVNNYWLKDSSMLPIYEKKIKKVKLDILTKKQEYDGYYKLYEELYNKNYTIKRKVLDEINIDTINVGFYDQYKILKKHAIVQVSKKQDALNQIEEYQKKIMENYDKEIKQKNNILKDLQLHIEVFKEDEKDLLNKLTKIMKKRDEITEIIKDKVEKNIITNNNLKNHIKRYNRSYISLDKIFKSVNAKNLDDVLLDADNIKHNFNKLRNRIMEINKEITVLNSQYVKHCKQLEEIKNDIIKLEEKKKVTYERDDMDRVEEIKNELNELNKEKNKINEITLSKIGTFQKGITFLFQNIKIITKTIKPIRKKISPNLESMLKKYEMIPFSLDYSVINKDFLTNFAFIFFKFSHIIFYLNLNSMSSSININNINENLELKSLYNKESLSKYEIGMKKSIETYNRRVNLKQQKMLEIERLSRKIEIDKKKNKNLEDDNIMTHEKIFKGFLTYLSNKSPSAQKENSKNDDLYNSNQNIFFTGLNITKSKQKNNKDNSLNDSQNKINTENQKNKKSYSDTRNFLIKNPNKFKRIFYKYKNDLIKENERNLYLQKKNNKKILFRSNSQPKIKSKLNFIKTSVKTSFSLSTRKKNEKKIISINKKTKPKLMDDNYDYDDDNDDDQIKINNLNLKKNKTTRNFTFFKFNKDRANIYTKMNDLRVLQMGYFGGRFLNTNINSDNLLHGSNNIFDEFMNNYKKTKNLNNENNKKKKKTSNLKVKLVEKISANRKLRDKSSFLIKKVKNIKIDYKNNTTYDRFKSKNKYKFGGVNKKNTFSTIQNGSNTNKYKKFNKLGSKSLNDDRVSTIKKNLMIKRSKSIY